MVKYRLDPSWSVNRVVRVLPPRPDSWEVQARELALPILV